MIRLYIGFLLISGTLLSCSGDNDTTVYIYADQIISPSDEFIGNGVQWSAYPHADSDQAEWGLIMTDEKWTEVFERLDYMRPRIVRVMDQANWRYLKGFDAAGNPILDFENQEMQALYKLLDYCEANGIIVILGEWGEPYQVHDTHLGLQQAFDGANDPAWHRIIVKHLDHLINVKKYSVIRYYNLINEPNGYWSSVDGDWEQWKEGLVMLNEEIRVAGLDHMVSLIGPDATPYDNEASVYTGYEWAVESVKQLSNVFSAYDIHDYPLKDFVRSGEFQKHYSELVRFADATARKPFIFGEIGFEKWTEDNLERVALDPHASEDSQLSVYDYDYGVDMADMLIQSMNSGFDATIAWGLDDAMHTIGDLGDPSQLKKWGMWNILGTELTGDASEEKIRPWFYTWSLLTRYFPGETNIVRSDEVPSEKTRLVAGVSDSGDLTVAIVNNSEESVQVSFSLKQRKQGLVLKKYLYAEHRYEVDKNGFPVPEFTGIKPDVSGVIKLIMPPGSFVLYTTYTY